MPRKGKRSQAAKLRHQRRRMQSQQLHGDAPSNNADDAQQKPAIYGHDYIIPQKTNEVRLLSKCNSDRHRKVLCRARKQMAETPAPVSFSSITENTDAPLHSPSKKTSRQTFHSPSPPSVRHGKKKLMSDILSSSACKDSTSSWLPVIVDVFSLSDPRRGRLLSSPTTITDNEETNDDLVIQESILA
ncbi:uncharacterized protein LOC144060269 [Vanacampus margaritifer]